MNSLFTSVLEISWQAGLIALAVMAVRPLRRASTRFPALSNAGSAGRRKSNKEQ